MIFRTPKEKIDEYYENNSLNQTALKTIIGPGGMQAYLYGQQSIARQEDELYYEEKEHFVVGSAVDTYLTMGEQYYLENYHFSNVKKPGDSVMAIVKMVYDSLKTKFGDVTASLELCQEEIYEACNANKYYMNRARPNAKDVEANEKLPDDSPKIITWKHDNRWQTIVKDGSLYFEDLKVANGKQVLSDTQNALVNQIISNYTTHPFTSWIFQDMGNVDIVYQFIIYFQIEGVWCKAMIDEVRIDHDKKLIMPLDIKTFGDHVTKFNREVRRRRYDIQGSFYRKALILNLANLSAYIGKDVTDYTVANFAFVVESTKNPGTPIICPLAPELQLVGEVGDAEQELYGWWDGLMLYKQWNDKGLTLEGVLQESKGVVRINNKFEFTKTI